MASDDSDKGSNEAGKRESMKRTREERNTVKSIFKLLDDIVTPETIRAYKAWEHGYITADEARIEIANCILKEAIEQRNC